MNKGLNYSSSDDEQIPSSGGAGNYNNSRLQRNLRRSARNSRSQNNRNVNRFDRAVRDGARQQRITNMADDDEFDQQRADSEENSVALSSSYAKTNLPTCAEDFFKDICRKVNTKQLLEIVQVFSYQQDRTNQNKEARFKNDYSVIVLKINSPQLIRYYGNGKYLVQVWRFKKRLFQHVHNEQIEKIYLNATEFAYILEKPQIKLRGNSEDQDYKVRREPPFDSDKKFIYIVQPFSCNFARIEYPEDLDRQVDDGDIPREPVIFINDEVLVIAKNQDLRFYPTDTFLGDDEDGQRSSNKVKYYSQRAEGIDLDDNADNRGNFGRGGGYENDFNQRDNRNEENLTGPYKATIEEQKKQLLKNAGFYGDSSRYSQKFKRHLDSKTAYCNCSILAIQQMSVMGKGSQMVPGIYVIASDKTQIFIYKLEHNNLRNVDEHSDHEAYNMQGEEAYEDGDQINALTKIRDFTLRDEPQSAQLVQISETQVITFVLYNKSQLFDVIYNLNRASEGVSLDKEQLQKDNLFVQKYQFGSQKLHIQASTKKGDPDLKVQQWTVNSQTGKLNIGEGSKTLDKGAQLIDSQIDEDLVQNHVQVFEDIKMISGLLLLSHGSIVSIYNTALSCSDQKDSELIWTHYFNRGKHQTDTNQNISAMLTRKIQLITDPVIQHLIKDEEATKFKRYPKSIMKQLDILKFDPRDRRKDIPIDQVKLIKDGDLCRDANDVMLKSDNLNKHFAQHCYFNRKEYDIKGCAFKSHKAEEFTEFFVNQVGGEVRVISLCYMRNLVQKIRSEPIRAFHAQMNQTLDNQANDNNSKPMQDQKMSQRLAEFVRRTPRINMQEIGNLMRIDDDNQHNPRIICTEMYSQGNMFAYSQIGHFDSRVYLNMLEINGDKAHANLFVCDNQFSTIKKLVKLDSDIEEDDQIEEDENQSQTALKLVPVCNAKSDQLFVYNPTSQTLYLVKAEVDLQGPSQSGIVPVLENTDFGDEFYLIPESIKNNIILMVKNFDFGAHKKYFLSGKNLLYQKQGNIVSIDLVSGQFSTIDFNHAILDEQFFIMPSNSCFYITKEARLKFTDLKILLKDFQVIQQDVVPCLANLCDKFEIDPIKNCLVLFLKTNECYMVPDLSMFEDRCIGTQDLIRRYLSYNINRQKEKKSEQFQLQYLSTKQPALEMYQTQSPYNFIFSLFDAQINEIKTCMVGHGNIIKISVFDINEKEVFRDEMHQYTLDFNDFKVQTKWHGHTLVMIEYAKQLSIINQKIVEVQNLTEEFKQSKQELTNELKDILESPQHNPRIASQVQRLKAIEDQLIYTRDQLQNQEMTKYKLNLYRLIKIKPDGVFIKKQFRYTTDPTKKERGEKEKLYVSSDGDILLAMGQKTNHVAYDIRDKANPGWKSPVRAISVQGVEYIKYDDRLPNINTPVYFSDDFRYYLTFIKEFDPVLKNDEWVIKLWNLLDDIDMTYLEVEAKNILPEFASVKKSPKSLPYIYIKGNEFISYITTDNVEQTIPIKKEVIKIDQVQTRIITHKPAFDEVTEYFLNDEQMCLRQRQFETQFGDDNNIGMSENEIFMYQSLESMKFHTDQKRIRNYLEDQLEFGKEEKEVNPVESLTKNKNIEDEKKTQCIKHINQVSQSITEMRNPDGVTNSLVYSRNNLRIMRPYSYHSWKLIEMIVYKELDISQLDDHLLQELLQIVFPEGTTFLSHLLEMDEVEIFESILRRIKKSKNLTLYLSADIKGETALHLCLRNSYSRASDKLLDAIQNDSIGNHIDLIRDILPDILKSNPQATCRYLDSRLIQCPWFLTSSSGDLNQPVYADVLKTYGPKEDGKQELEMKIFHQSERANKRLPIQIKVFDFPCFHNIQSKESQNFVAALLEAEDDSIFETYYIQCLIQYMWPPVLSSYTTRILYVHVFTAIVFFYYSVYHFEWQNDYMKSHHQSISSFLFYEGLALKSLIAILMFIKLLRECAEISKGSCGEYLQDIYNYLDWTTIILVVASITMSFVVEFQSYQKHPRLPEIHHIRTQSKVNSSNIEHQHLVHDNKTSSLNLHNLTKPVPVKHEESSHFAVTSPRVNYPSFINEHVKNPQYMWIQDPYFSHQALIYVEPSGEQKLVPVVSHKNVTELPIPHHAMVNHQTHIHKAPVESHVTAKPIVNPKPSHFSSNMSSAKPVEHHKVTPHTLKKNETHIKVEAKQVSPHVVQVNKTHAIVVPHHAIPINKTHAVVFEHPKTHKILHNLTHIDSTTGIPKIVPIQNLTKSAISKPAVNEVPKKNATPIVKPHAAQVHENKTVVHQIPKKNATHVKVHTAPVPHHELPKIIVHNNQPHIVIPVHHSVPTQALLHPQHAAIHRLEVKHNNQTIPVPLIPVAKTHNLIAKPRKVDKLVLKNVTKHAENKTAQALENRKKFLDTHPVVTTANKTHVAKIVHKNGTKILNSSKLQVTFNNKTPVKIIHRKHALELLNEDLKQKDSQLITLQRYFNAFSFLLLFLKFGQMLEITQTFGTIVASIRKVIVKMIPFLLIFFLSIFGFSGAFFILNRNNSEDQDIIHSILMVFEWALGNFDTTTFGKTGFYVEYVIFILLAILIIIIMMNLLIAIISDAFSELQDQKIKEMYKLFAENIVDNRYLVDEEVQRDYSVKGNYLFSVSLANEIEYEESEQEDDKEDQQLQIREGLDDLKKLLLKKNQ